MKILHLCAALDGCNGMANTARQFVAEELSQGHDSKLTNQLADLSGKPDRVVIHGSWLPILHRAAKRATAIGAEVVIRPAGSYDPVRLQYHAWKKALMAPFEHAMLRRANRIWATCPEEEQWIRAYHRGASVEVIDLRRFFKIPAAVPCVSVADGQPLRVLYLGRDHPLKGIEYLRRAVADLNGSGQPPCVELQLVHRAHGAELEHIWRWADVLVLPTLSENFGRVVAEALERGKFVITTDGAPAWADLRPEQGIYLRGFREGSDEERVGLIRFGLKGLAAGRENMVNYRRRYAGD